jgi:hypothetical protein
MVIGFIKKIKTLKKLKNALRKNKGKEHILDINYENQLGDHIYMHPILNTLKGAKNG